MAENYDLDICVLGFGKMSRALIDAVKRFPGYGVPPELGYRVHIHMVYVNRETWAYGPNLVVPIEDKEHNASRTYKDGLEAVRRYETTVSCYEDWLLEHVAEDGDLNTLIDCTPYTESSLELVLKLLSNSKQSMHFYTISKGLIDNHLDELIAIAEEREITLHYDYFNLDSPEEVIDKLVNDLRLRIDGGKPWTPVQFSEEFMGEAAKLSAQAAENAKIVLQRQRDDMVQTHLADGYKFDPSVFQTTKALSETDVKTIERFVINGEGDFEREENYNEEEKCRVISHEMLYWYFGKYRVDFYAATMFARSDLDITNATCYIYDSPDSRVKKKNLKGDCQYAILITVKSQYPWVQILENQEYNVVVPPREAIGFTAELGPIEAGVLGKSGNREAVILTYHLAPRKFDGSPNVCTCYDS